MPHLQGDAPHTSSLRADAQDLRRALSELIRVYGFRDRERICCHDLSVTQSYALDMLGKTGPLTLNALSAELYLEKSTTSRIVNGLEAKGYAMRKENPASGRSILIAITPRGETIRQRIEEELLAEEMLLLEGADPAVRRATVQLVTKLARAAAARIDTSGGTCCTI